MLKIAQNVAKELTVLQGLKKINHVRSIYRGK